MSILGKIAAANKPSKPPVPYSKATGGISTFGAMASGKEPIEQMGGLGTIFSIVHRTSTATAAVEWDLYRKPADGRRQDDAEREPAGKHAALDVWRRPNSFLTTAGLVEACQQHLDLVGETFIVVVKTGQIPIELWPIRPDRMTPVPDPAKFIAGYIYKDPDGNKIPLNVDEVIHIKMPNPADPFRGLSPLAAITTEIEAAKYSAEWNRNFFLNSAEPGGVIELPTNLSDSQWDEFVDRWRSQHQGVKNAHRVAVIEHAGKYVPRGYSQRDMEFTALRTATRDTIMEAYGASKPMLGITDDVNRANAEASLYMFAQYLLVPRLRRWQEALNHQLLPMFGATGESVEFAFVDPVEENSEAAALNRTSKVDAVVKLSGLQGVKFDVDALMEAFDLPVIPWEEQATPLAGQMFGPDGEILPPAPTVPPGGDAAGAGTKRGAPPGGTPAKGKPAPGKSKTPPKPPPAKSVASECECDHVGQSLCFVHSPAVLAADDPPEWDPTEHDQAWQEALDRLLQRWESISREQRAQLAQQIAQAIDSDDLAALADLSVDSNVAAEVLQAELERIAHVAATAAAAEAAAQGAQAPASVPQPEELSATAVAVVALLATGLAVAAGREALRRQGEGKSGVQVAREVTEYLTEQTDSPLRTALGAALHGTQNRARVETWKRGPVGSIYASEVLDQNTCGPCRRIDGRFICTTEDTQPLDRLYTAIGGYVDCEGGPRCRGTVTGAWRPKTVDQP